MGSLRAALSLVLATLVLLAMLPVTVIAMEPADVVVIEDAAELSQHGDMIDADEPSSPALDDDVLHGSTLVCAPSVTMQWGHEPWHPHPEGRVPSRSRRPPRAR